MKRGSKRRDRQQAISFKRGAIGNAPQPLTDDDRSFMNWLMEGVRQKRAEAVGKQQSTPMHTPANKNGPSEGRESEKTHVGNIL